ncbi:hypothetical protein LTR97_009581 [Elasticomyces elasticus]|uniref:SET domain-containing protein n=1 Tax=Elasticomyces elasticus TaxID=574655 RepID=A0AAN7W1W9_9PEZI|nr:hypothetical protein LTR97_009581 [Elasticomyces elasticus]
MPTPNASVSAPAASLTLHQRARTTYRVRAKDVSKVICHRLHNGREEYLIAWRVAGQAANSRDAIYSWHCVGELSSCLHYVQTYIEGRTKSKAPGEVKRSGPGFVALPTSSSRSSSTSADAISRKRKLSQFARDADIPSLDEAGSDVTTPRDSGYLSREQSVISISSSSSVSEAATQAIPKALAKTVAIKTEDQAQVPCVYNGLLQKKEGWFMTKKSSRPAVHRIDGRKLPDQTMIAAAARVPVTEAEDAIRLAFNRNLQKVKLTRWENKVDKTAPSLDFTWISEFVFGEGIYRPDVDAHEGCDEPCKANMGQNIGCEYPRLCTCLEFAAVDENRIQLNDTERYKQFLKEREDDGYLVNSEGLPKRFPYQKSSSPKIPSTLQKFYLDSRYPIYECNLNCNCGPVCKSRVVQKGRRVPLVIFKTADRGWGVYCDEELVRGEFIDTYVGEVITGEESDRRVVQMGEAKQSYLYALDKFIGDSPDLNADTCYVVDGQYKGGPTRFINHSCEPNCRQYTVSYNKHDLKVYDLAFFAIDNIPAGTELTFDYQDEDVVEEEEFWKTKEEALADPDNKDKRRCQCGARLCRGILW